MPLGLTVTLRREKMYAFLEKFIKIVLPRIRDFRGLNPNNFDKHGELQFRNIRTTYFPEIDYDNVEQGEDLILQLSQLQKHLKKVDSY